MSVSDPEAVDDDIAHDIDASDGAAHDISVELTEATAGERLDKALSHAVPELSRGRVQALIADGAVRFGETPVTDISSKARPGLYSILVPALASAIPQPQDLGLVVLFEDADLIVLDKPAGMAAHPAPGTPDGTLVNALLYHCAGGLSGIGGVMRPGIVHRLDKDTSGVMVAAKSDAAHQGLSALFAAHDIERAYTAFVRSALEPSRGTITSRLGRSQHDRKKMAVLRTGGREAITHYRTQATFGPQAKPLAAKMLCRLETGRTHQIRVHLASKGVPVLGDPIYGSGSPTTAVREAMADAGLKRQALHAAVLGFVHPITGQQLRFETPLPDDMSQLETNLSARFFRA